MIKIVCLSLGVCALPCLALGQSQRSLLRSGNKAYAEGAYTKAQEAYTQARLKGGKETLEAQLSLGTSLYQQKKFDEATKAYEQALKADYITPEQGAKAWHNLGNIAMQAKKYEEAVKAYKQSLILNPSDEDTRYNLVLAQKQIKPNPQGGGGGGGDNSEDNKDKQEQNPNNPPKQNNSDNSSGQGGENKPQEQNEQEGNNPPKQGQTAQGKMSREQAEQLLRNYGQGDEATRRRVERKERERAEDKQQKQNKPRW